MDVVKKVACRSPRHARCFAGVDGRIPLFVGLARARFDLSMAAPGLSASRKKVLGGRNLSPRNGSTRLYLMNGMSREATQEFGGWETPGAIENEYTKDWSEEVEPEMRSAIKKARADVCGRFGRQFVPRQRGCCWFRKRGSRSCLVSSFCTLKAYLKPSIVLPIRDNFPGTLGRRVRRLGLSGVPKICYLTAWGRFSCGSQGIQEFGPACSGRGPGQGRGC